MSARSGRTPDGFQWHLAPALVVLEDEVNARYPGRSTASDGSIASARHSQQNPTSDHEADRGDGYVKALDLTTSAQFDAHKFARKIVANRDPRIKYVISDRQMARSYAKPGIPAWTWTAYTGSNPHTLHAHISVTDEGANDTRSWFTTLTPTAIPTPAPEDDMKLLHPHQTDGDKTGIWLLVGDNVGRVTDPAELAELQDTFDLDCERVPNRAWLAIKRVSKLDSATAVAKIDPAVAKAVVDEFNRRLRG